MPFTIDDLGRLQNQGNSSNVALLSDFDPDEVARTACAFANRIGGEIYFGVKPSKQRAGVAPINDRDIRPGFNSVPVRQWQTNRAKHFGHNSPSIKFDVLEYGDREFPRLTVIPSDGQVTLADGTSWYRDGSVNKSMQYEQQKNVSVGAVASSPVIPTELANAEPNSIQKEDPAGRAMPVTSVVETSPQSIEQSSHAREGKSTAASQIGGRTEFSGDAAEHERCLNCNQYAHAIANLFAQTDATKRLCFGLFGHWGRGKTYLIENVADLLEKRGYATIRFSAWKYRTNPETWIYLYESVIKAAAPHNLLLPIQASFARIGPWPAISAIGIFTGSMQTLGEQVDTLHSAIQWFGLAGLIYIGFLYLRTRTFVLQLKHLYWALPRHDEKLGLQATIGADLQSLLVGWLPIDRLQWKRAWRPRWLTERREQYFATILYFIACSVVFMQLLTMPLVASLDGILPSAFGITKVGYATAASLSFVWIALMLMLPYFALLERPTGQRALLIVDDLDRCHPDSMIEIIESVQLLLDETEIASRLQVCMLIDESALNHALVKKYESLTTSQLGSSHQFSRRRIVRENIEKFFQVHLRLPPASEDEIEEMAQKFTGVLPIENSQHETSGADDMRRHDDSEDVTPETSPIDLAEDAPAKVVDTLLFTDEERTALLAVIPELKNCRDSGSWGPRAIRHLIFRYQLARGLLIALGETSIDPTTLWRRLIYQTDDDYPFMQYPTGRIDDQGDEEFGMKLPTTLDRVIAQVR